MSSLPESQPPRDPELRARWVDVHAIQAEADGLLGGLSDTEVNGRPRPEKWSIAQHLDHLAVTWTEYKGVVAPAIEDARRRGLVAGNRGSGDGGRGGHYPRSLVVRLFIWSLAPPPRMRLKTPAQFHATPGNRSVSQVRSLFVASQEDLLEHVHAADGLDLGKVRFASPVSSRFKMNLAECLAVLTTHARRHLWLCDEVKRALRR